MTVGLNFLASVIENGAGTNLLRLEDDLFVNENEERAFEFMRRYYRQHREVPDARIVQEQTGVRMPNARGNLAYHTDNLYERRTFDSVRDTYSQLRDAIAQHRPGPAIEVLEGGLRRLRTMTRDESLIDIGHGIGQVIQRLEQVQGLGGLSGVPTPWDTLNYMSAGYQPSDLISFVGRMGTGKTMNLLWQAEHAYNAGYSVLVVTTEMGSEQIVRRWLAMRFGLDPHALKSGMVSTYLMGRLRQWSQDILGRERFRILPLGTGGEISKIEAAVDEMAPDIIFIDGVYLLKPSRTRPSNRNETVAYVFDEIKQLTIDTRRPWVVNTQFNRQAGSKGKDGSLETIGMSDVIGQHSSIVIAVKPGPTANPFDSRELDLLKGREGENGSLVIHYTFKPTNLNEMTAEERAAIETNAPDDDDDEGGYQWR